jgi:CheY-like chemotaxis protein
VKDETPYTSVGGERQYEYIFVPVLGSDGAVEAVAGSTRDITERKRAEDDLREADRRKDEFLATLAHELRNPLAPIRNGLQVLKLIGNAGHGVEQARTMMERQLTQMVRLVDDLLDVSRITRNKLELRKGRVELAAIVNSAVETSNPLIEAGGHELTVALPSEPIFLDADPSRLAQVFANLLNNAAKYTEQGGRVRLTAERHDNEVVVAVEDNGIGIRREMLPTVFEMFTQADRALERAQGGLGIGLTLVKRLVEMHDGTVEAQSAGHGQGSTFVVRLPVVLEPLERDQSHEPSGEKQAVPKRRILVVDDNEDAAGSLSMLLKIMGNEVGEAHDGQEAVEAARTFQPSVILLDIGLPKLNGYEACRRIREQPGGKAVVIVALTGWGQEEDVRRSTEAGFNHHLVKPVDPADLARLLAELKSEGN